MAKLLDYLYLRKDITFKERSFNTIDAMVLTELAYIDWDDIVTTQEISMKEAIEKYLELYSEENILTKYAFTNQLFPFLISLKDNKRFNSIKLKNYVELLDKEECVQFAAITYVLDANTLFIAYQGTDSTMVGWKEDFHLTYMDEVPAQRYAYQYLANSYNSRFRRKKIYVGGHSKGGNLAMYAAIQNPQLADKIIRVYNFEGPGFLERFIEKTDISPIVDKIYTICAESSIIGRLLYHPEKIHYVKSDVAGLSQHSLFNWLIDIDDIIYADGLDQKSDESFKYIDQMLLSKTDKQKERYSTLLFDVFDNLQIETVKDLMDIQFKKISGAVMAFASMSGQEKLFTIQVINFLLEQSRILLFGNISFKRKHTF